MWLEHLLFGAVDDTSFAVSCKALSLVQFQDLFDIYGKRTETRIVLRNIISKVKEDERRTTQQPFGCEE